MNVNKKCTIIICIAVVFCILSSCQNISDKSDVTPGAYFLENATPKEIYERLLSVTIYADGKIRLATPWISSYMLIDSCIYSLEDGELLVRYENSDDVIAVFTVDGDNTLVFKEASVPLYADAGARYVYTPCWISFDENKITVYADNIPGIEVFQVIGEQTDQWTVSDKNQIVSFAEWAEQLILEKAIFDDGYSPGEIEGEYGYLLRTSFGGYLFEYGKYSDGEHYIYFDSEWYHVNNPSAPPLSE